MSLEHPIRTCRDGVLLQHARRHADALVAETGQLAPGCATSTLSALQRSTTTATVDRERHAMAADWSEDRESAPHGSDASTDALFTHSVIESKLAGPGRSCACGRWQCGRCVRSWSSPRPVSPNRRCKNLGCRVLARAGPRSPCGLVGTARRCDDRDPAFGQRPLQRRNGTQDNGPHS